MFIVTRRHLVASTLVSLGLALAACTVNAPINATLGGRGEVPANADEVKNCKAACNSQKTANCLDDAALAACTAACSGATSDQVATYDDCVKASACDMSCTASLPPADAGTASKDSGSHTDAAKSDSGTVDATADAGDLDAGLSDCMMACDNATECYTSPTTEKSECYSYCSEATPTARENFAGCALPSNGCSMFYSVCWPALMSGH